jgi:hypothetical protein
VDIDAREPSFDDVDLLDEQRTHSVEWLVARRDELCADARAGPAP